MSKLNGKSGALSRRQAIGSVAALGIGWSLAGCAAGMDMVVAKGTAAETGATPFKVIWLVKRKSGLTVEQFREGYRHHVSIILKYLGPTFSEYRLNFPNEAFGGIKQLSANEGYISGPIPVDYDCLTEMRCPSREAFDEGLRIAMSPGVSEVIDADENKFIDHKSVISLFGEEVRII